MDRAECSAGGNLLIAEETEQVGTAHMVYSHEQ